MVKGLYITKIKVLGSHKEPAEIVFKKGLNVVSGASDTGKTYIFQCLDFIFGSKKPLPKDVPEAKDYDEVRVEIRTYSDEVYTLSRKFFSSVITLTSSTEGKFELSSKRELSRQHSSESENNVSTFILNICDMKNVKLKKNNRNEKQNLSFRNVAKFCMISEERIIQEESPIYSGITTDKTLDESLFKYLVTGKDDDDLETLEDPKVAKSALSGKIEYISKTLDEKKQILIEMKLKYEETKNDELNLQISELSQKVEEANKSVIEQEISRQEIWKVLSSKKKELNEIRELIRTFKLLYNHYNSDLERLEFISEGQENLEKKEKNDCPLCGSKILERFFEEVEEDPNILEGLRTEYIKTTKKKLELEKTLEDLFDQEEKILDLIEKDEEKFESVDKYIKGKLMPVYEVNSSKLNEVIRIKQNSSKIELLEKEICKLIQDKEYYEAKKEKQKENSKIKKSIEDKETPDEYYFLTAEIKNLLNKWKMNTEAVNFNFKTQDLEIDNKERKSFGKGMRALYTAAFSISLMKIASKFNKKHPFFVVLDSPLTSYGEKDLNQEEISDEVKTAFYETTAKLNFNNSQIIIIDNKAPSANPSSNINHIHFSGNKAFRRSGFFEN